MEYLRLIRFISLYFMLLLFIGCVVITKIEDLTISPDDKGFTIKNKLNTDGYFFSEEDAERSEGGKLLKYKRYNIIIFYQDGFIVKVDNVPETIFPGKIITPSEWVEYMTKRSYKENNYLDWGLYQINRDTLTIQSFYRIAGGLTIVRGIKEVAECRAIILNDTTFRVFERNLPSRGKKRQVDELFRFQNFHPKPDSTNWIRNSKWYQRRLSKVKNE